MSTNNALPRMRTGAGLSALSVLGWLLVVLVTVSFSFLSPIAFAASTARMATSKPAEDITRAGVSVVRLVVQYTGGAPVAGTPGSVGTSNNKQQKTTPTPTSPSQTPPGQLVSCTGLGIIVGSWSSAATDSNTWVLTDGGLVNNSRDANCATGLGSNPALQTIDLFPSTAYTSTPAPVALPANKVSVSCTSSCINTAAVLFSFHSDTLYPYTDLFTTSSAQEAYAALTQQDASTLLTPSSADQAQSFLSPYRDDIKTGDSIEVGTPVVNAQGELSSLRLKAGTNSPPAAISSLIATFVTPQQKGKLNSVHDNWQAGITAFYKSPSDYAGAQTAFQQAAGANPAFQGATSLAQQAKNLQASGNNAGSGTPTPGGQNTSPQDRLTQFFGTFPLLVWVLIGVGIVLFIVLLVLLSRMYSRDRTRAQRLKEDLAAAERHSKLDAPRIAAMEAQPPAPQMPLPQPVTTQQLQPTLHLPPMPQKPPVANNVVRANTPPLATFPCPHCGAVVQRGMARCPNCLQPFSLSDSGFFRRVQQPVPPPAPPMQPSLSSGIPDFPTLEISPSMQPMPRSGHEMSPVRNQLPFDNEKTLTSPPIPPQQLRLNRLGFAVGTRSDPGIKRKFKPNEDSFFAAEGMREGASSMQQFGLFVVADGMGGHANGQDASRRAIQAIIEYVLPRLKQSGDANDEQFAQLLTAGIQEANQEVHRHNQEEHADTGTTVTAALIVGMTAYVANVGDSRTYLLREGEKLRKVTSDHSVVASLVQAGIIKDDDIYTHPKRNQIYRSLGEKPAVEVDHFIERLQVGDKLLLCSDGLWDMVRDPRIEEVLKGPVPDPSMTGEALIGAALEGGGEDNVSVIVVQIIDNPATNGKLGVQLINKSESVHMI